MKLFVHILLALVMLLPSLACAMPPHDMAPPSRADMPPCHEHHEAGTKTPDPAGPMLMEECTGVDYAAQDIQFVDIPDQKIVDIVFYAPVGLALSPIDPDLGTSIRGPPDWLESAFPEPDILLTTQRLRI